nr:MAG TPA: hypothetical protein [Caudoviricetes sp.]
MLQLFNTIYCIYCFVFNYLLCYFPFYFLTTYK